MQTLFGLLLSFSILFALIFLAIMIGSKPFFSNKPPRTSVEGAAAVAAVIALLIFAWAVLFRH